MSFVNCCVCKRLISINCQVKGPNCSCAFHDFCLYFESHSQKKITPRCSTANCLSRLWWVTQEQMDDHKAYLIELEKELCESLENLGTLKIQLGQSEYIVERMVELIKQLNPKAYNSIKQQRLVDYLKKVANSSKKHRTLQEVNVVEQKNVPSALDECANNLELLNNEQKPVEKTSPYCKCVFRYDSSRFGFLCKKEIIPTCSAANCRNGYWLVLQHSMDEHKAYLIRLENELCENLENLGPLKIQLRQSEDIVEWMVQLINLLDLKAYNSIKQQMLVDKLKKVANSSKKYQTLQEVNVTEQKNVLSPLDECANNLESSNNEQKSVDETKIFNNAPTTTNIHCLEEHPHASEIGNLHAEMTQINEQSSKNLENLKELNDKINSTVEQKRFEEFAENMEKKIALLLEQNIRLEKNINHYLM